MISARGDLIVRDASADDAVPLARILNAIIEAGGTTAMEGPLNPAEFAEHFLRGPDVFCCVVAVDPAGGEPIGFQALKRYAELPEGWADIATFARMKPKLPGVGTALFAATKAKARKLGLVAINAAIRADNRGGLAFYEKMGFRTYETLRRVPLKDGTPVDRILKRYDLV
jgi:L-amino acid N-acyltransferase YncA